MRQKFFHFANVDFKDDFFSPLSVGICSIFILRLYGRFPSTFFLPFALGSITRTEEISRKIGAKRVGRSCNVI